LAVISAQDNVLRLAENAISPDVIAGGSTFTYATFRWATIYRNGGLRANIYAALRPCIATKQAGQRSWHGVGKM
jgi:hypothetical protein